MSEGGGRPPPVATGTGCTGSRVSTTSQVEVVGRHQQVHYHISSLINHLTGNFLASEKEQKSPGDLFYLRLLFVVIVAVLTPRAGCVRVYIWV